MNALFVVYLTIITEAVMTPKERRKLWYDMLEREIPLVEKRINEGIQNNRKFGKGKVPKMWRMVL